MKIKIALSLGLMLALVGLILQPVVALPTHPNGMNARFIKWENQQQTIHIFYLPDAGTPGQPAAQVGVGQPILFGFEWVLLGGTVAELQDFVDHPDHDVTLSVNGAVAVFVTSGYQPAFFAATQSGPAWSWDHDGDGRGDGDGDGIGDWSGPTLFFRYQSPGMPAGTHTFEFCILDPLYGVVCETATVTAS